MGNFPEKIPRSEVTERKTRSYDQGRFLACQVIYDLRTGQNLKLFVLLCCRYTVAPLSSLIATETNDFYMVMFVCS